MNNSVIQKRWRKDTWFYLFITWFLHVWAKVWLRYETFGAEEYIPKSGGCILASNHASFIDPPIIGASVRFRRMVHFMARDTLFKFKPFGDFLLTMGVMPISRSKGDVGALKKSIKTVQEGKVVAIYPEGTRTHDGALQEPKGGIGFLVARAKVPVIPIYIQDSFKALSRHHSWARPHKVKVYFGKAITPEEIAALGEGREIYGKAAELIMSRIAELEKQARA